MKPKFSWSDYFVFAFILAVYASIGIYYRFNSYLHKHCKRWIPAQKEGDKCTNETEEIFLASRSLGLFPIVCSITVSFLSAISLMGTAAEGYQFGIQFLCLIGGYCIAYPLASEVYMPVFYQLRITSAHAYLEMRFNKVVRWVTSLVFIVQMISYISLALYAPSLAFSQTSGLPFWLSLISTGLVATFYTALGGMRAVVWTDVIQLIVLVIGLCVIVILGTIRVGGVQTLWNTALSGQRLTSFSFDPNPFVRHSFWTFLIGGSGLVLSIYGTNQTLVQRYLSSKNMKTARIAILLNLPLNTILLLIQLGIGLIMYAIFVNCDPVQSGMVQQYDQLLPYTIMYLFDGIPVIRGLFLSVIYAAALSTVSSGVNSLANVFLEDLVAPAYTFYRGKMMNDKLKRWLAFSLAGIIGMVILGLSFLYNVLSSRVLQIAFSLFGALGGPVLAVFSLGMLTPCINSKGALAGLICSVAVGLWLAIGSIFHPVALERLPLSVNGCVAPVPSRPPVGPQSHVWTVYSLSYQYYTLVCLLTAGIVAFIVSAICKFNTKYPIPRYLLAKQANAVYQHLPNCLPTQTCDDEEILTTTGEIQSESFVNPPHMKQFKKDSFEMYYEGDHTNDDTSTRSAATEIRSIPLDN